MYCFQNNLSAGNHCWLPLHPTGVPSGLLPNCAVLFPMHEATALKFRLQQQAVPVSSLFRGGFRGFCCRLALCHNSYSVVLSAATQRFGRRNWVLFAILPAIKMLSPFPHTRIMHADSNSTLFHKSEFAHKLPQSIFSVKSFFCGGTWQIHTTNSQKRILALKLCILPYKSPPKSIKMLWFPSRVYQIFCILHNHHFHDSTQKIKRCQCLTNAYSVPAHFIHPIYTQFRTKRTA